MNLRKRIIQILKFCLVTALVCWIGVLSLPADIVSADDDDTTSSSSSSAGQTLYDALRAIYGDTSNTSSTSTSSTSSKATSSTMTTEQLMKRMETEPVGPTVNDVSLEEIYHEDYKVYEERLSDTYTIYANVKNGAITNRPVVIDVPRGVGASLKRDGTDIDFESKQVIETEGAYVLTLFVVETQEDFQAFSTQTVSRARFRFRIQYKTGVNGVVGSEGDGNDVVEEGTDSLSEYAALVEGTLPEDMLPDDFVYEESQDLMEQGTASGNSAPAAPMLVDGKAFESSFDTEMGYYRNTLKTGDVFYTNVPNGAYTNEAVLVQESPDLQMKLYREGELIEGYQPGNYITVTGSYALELSRDDASFKLEYNARKPVFYFRILGDPVSDAGIINAPQGATFRSVRHDGEDTGKSLFLSDTALHIEEDGTYEVTVDDEAGSREFTLIYDGTQPFFTVSTEPNKATISYLSSDISRCVLYRNNEVVEDTGVIKEVTQPGKYTIYVYDTAGNRTQSQFMVHYRINAAAVIAIFGILALIAGVAVYIIRIRKNVKVV